MIHYTKYLISTKRKKKIISATCLGDDFDAEEAKFDGGARELERMRLTLET